jgi:hypothetical protein
VGAPCLRASRGRGPSRGALSTPSANAKTPGREHTLTRRSHAEKGRWLAAGSAPALRQGHPTRPRDAVVAIRGEAGRDQRDSRHARWAETSRGRDWRGQRRGRDVMRKPVPSAEYRCSPSKRALGAMRRRSHQQHLVARGKLPLASNVLPRLGPAVERWQHLANLRRRAFAGEPSSACWCGNAWYRTLLTISTC